MPVFARLAAVIPCPRCLSDLTFNGEIGFQWGYCSTPLGGIGQTYSVGDEIVWRVDSQGMAPKWTYFRNGGGNLGDPNIGDLLVRESELDQKTCRKCGFQYDGIGITIRSGVIREARCFIDGLPGCDISVLDLDGLLVPRPEWDDHPMPVVADGGWCETMVTHSKIAKMRTRRRF